jgi:hypothetical protein
MKNPSNPTSLLWVNSSTADVRDLSKLRREVMRKVALRRKLEPKYPHPNSRQLPLFLHDDGISQCIASSEQVHTVPEAEPHGQDGKDGNVGNVKSETSSPSMAEPDNHHLQLSATQTSMLAFTHPSKLTKCHLRFLDLSLLASLEVGQFTEQRLRECRESLSHSLGLKNLSYCHYVPFQYYNSILVR